MHPGILFANVGHFEQMRVQPSLTNCVLEERFVSPWRAASYHNAVQPLLDHF